MKVINFAETPSLVGQYMTELRAVDIQGDMLRFRRNLERIGEIMAYEISKTLDYRRRQVQTPLAMTESLELATPLVLATIFRAGVPFHQGFLNYFDHSENAFVSAYRRYKEKTYKDHDDFDVCIEYLASPSIEGKTLVLADRPDARHRRVDGAELPRVADQGHPGPHTCGLGHRLAAGRGLHPQPFPGGEDHRLDRGHRP